MWLCVYFLCAMKILKKSGEREKKNEQNRKKKNKKKNIRFDLSAAQSSSGKLCDSVIYGPSY